MAESMLDRASRLQSTIDTNSFKDYRRGSPKMTEQIAAAEPHAPSPATPAVVGMRDMIVAAKKLKETINAISVQHTAATKRTIMRMQQSADDFGKALTKVEDLARKIDGHAMDLNALAAELSNLGEQSSSGSEEHSSDETK